MSVEVIENVEIFRTTQGFEINKLMAKVSLFCCFEKQFSFEQNDEISSEILQSFRTEVVEDKDVTFDKIQGS